MGVDLSVLMRYPDAGSSAGSGFLEDAGDEDWRLILHHAERRRCGPGEVIVHAGETDRALYVVLHGTFGFEYPGRRGVADEFIAPTVLGELAFLDGLPRAGTLRALTDGELLRLTFDAFEVLGAKHPNLGMRILADVGRIVALRLRKVGGSGTSAVGSG